MLMDHLEEEKVESKRKNGVIDFIHNHCKLTQFTEKEIRHVIGKLGSSFGYFVTITKHSRSDRYKCIYYW